MQTQISLLLVGQSNYGIHCLKFGVQLFEAFIHGNTSLCLLQCVFKRLPFSFPLRKAISLAALCILTFHYCYNCDCFFKFLFQPDLLPLIEGSSLTSKTSDNQQISSGEEPHIEIGEIWQRTYSDKWLVAVSFRNKSSR